MQPTLKNTGLKTGFKFTINGREYTDDTTNHYQKIIMLELARQQSVQDEMKRDGTSEENILKQYGVIEHYVHMLMLYDNIQEVDHLFPGAYEAAMQIQQEAAKNQREEMKKPLDCDPSELSPA
jgi:hypothetical protein